MFDQICFPPSVGLPFSSGPPTIDGFIEPDPGVDMAQLEAGYVDGARFAYDGNGAGVPLMALQGVTSGGFLYLSFGIRFDFSFDSEDRVVILLRPSPAASGDRLDERRIDIRPVESGSPYGGAGGGAPPPPDPLHNDIDNPGVLVVRTNRPPFAANFFKRSGTPCPPGPVWTDISDDATIMGLLPWDPAAADPAIRVRSTAIGSSPALYWSVEVRLPISAPSPWISLNQDFGLYCNVIRVCSGGCTGPSLNGQFCTQFTWPFDPSNPNTYLITDPVGTCPPIPQNWDIPAGNFGHGVLSPGQPTTCQGVRFKDGLLGIGVRQGASPSSPIGGVVDMTLTATNTMVARVYNNGADPAPDVQAEFRIADFGLGPYGTMAALWDKLPNRTAVSPPEPPPPGNPTVPKRIPASGSPAAPVDLTFDWTVDAHDRMTYGPLWSDQCLWVLLDEAGLSFNVTNATNASPIEITASIPHNRLTGDQVMVSGVLGNTAANGNWVVTVGADPMKFTLNGSAGNGGYTSGGIVNTVSTANFAEASVRRNLQFNNLSDQSGTATVSGQGYEPPPDGGPDHDFVLHVVEVPIETPQATPIGELGWGLETGPALTHGERDRDITLKDVLKALAASPIISGEVTPVGQTPSVTWLVVTNGYVKTKHQLTIGANTYSIYQHAGSFGHVATHELGPGETKEDVDLSYGLSGGGLVQAGDNVYTLKVPDGGAVTLNTRLAAGPTKPRKWWRRLLRLILAWLKKAWNALVRWFKNRFSK